MVPRMFSTVVASVYTCVCIYLYLSIFNNRDSVDISINQGRAGITSSILEMGKLKPREVKLVA